MTSAQVLRTAMKAKGWDETDLSKETGIHVTLIRRYFGKYTDKPVRIGMKNAPRLARALGVEIASLLFGRKAA